MAASPPLKPIIPAQTLEAARRKLFTTREPITATGGGQYTMFGESFTDMLSYLTWTPTFLLGALWMVQPQEGKWSNSMKEALLHPFEWPF
ncbi:hypothetical protein KP509_02G107500 [Ceratopteris richardii]|uniref:Uncharacterized protein n=1 Tax=Ceratopteris richardii TaxID=49495 RepID=A0A8T2VGX1_CERRI|nr:hypothetical protein KP509_02G107500 [Ceratopteris richardii]